MKFSDLVPWKWGGTKVPVDVKTHNLRTNPYHKELSSFFDNFFNSSPIGFSPSTFEKFESFSPRVDVEEIEREIVVRAELPGINDDDVNLTLKDDYLILEGEKRAQNEKKEGGVSYFESSYGSFKRVVPLDVEIDADGVDATMKNGVLTVKLPKTELSAKKSRQISVNAN